MSLLSIKAFILVILQTLSCYDDSFVEEIFYRRPPKTLFRLESGQYFLSSSFRIASIILLEIVFIGLNRRCFDIFLLPKRKLKASNQSYILQGYQICLDQEYLVNNLLLSLKL